MSDGTSPEFFTDKRTHRHRMMDPRTGERVFTGPDVESDLKTFDGKTMHTHTSAFRTEKTSDSEDAEIRALLTDAATDTPEHGHFDGDVFTGPREEIAESDKDIIDKEIVS